MIALIRRNRILFGLVFVAILTMSVSRVVSKYVFLSQAPIGKPFRRSSEEKSTTQEGRVSPSSKNIPITSPQLKRVVMLPKYRSVQVAYLDVYGEVPFLPPRRAYC